jgi:hypothetical protein
MIVTQLDFQPPPLAKCQRRTDNSIRFRKVGVGVFGSEDTTYELGGQ